MRTGHVDLKATASTPAAGSERSPGPAGPTEKGELVPGLTRGLWLATQRQRGKKGSDRKSASLAASPDSTAPAPRPWSRLGRSRALSTDGETEGVVPRQKPESTGWAQTVGQAASGPCGSYSPLLPPSNLHCAVRPVSPGILRSDAGLWVSRAEDITQFRLHRCLRALFLKNWDTIHLP